MIEQTRFLSTVFLCSEFKLENYLLWSKFLQEKCFRWCLFAGKKSQKLEPAKISCHTVVRNRPLYIGTLSLALLVGVWSICCSFCCCFCVCVWVGGGKEGWGRCIQIVGAALREVSSEGLGIGREGKRTSLLPPSIPSLQHVLLFILHFSSLSPIWTREQATQKNTLQWGCGYGCFGFISLIYLHSFSYLNILQ